MTNTAKATLAAIVCNFIFGLSFLFSKVALDHAQPSVLLSIRFLTAFSVMSLILLTGKQKVSFKNKPVGKLLLMGLVQPVI